MTALVCFIISVVNGVMSELNIKFNAPLNKRASQFSAFVCGLALGAGLCVLLFKK